MALSPHKAVDPHQELLTDMLAISLNIAKIYISRKFS